MSRLGSGLRLVVPKEELYGDAARILNGAALQQPVHVRARLHLRCVEGGGIEGRERGRGGFESDVRLKVW